jgi:hypothetical protein
MFPSLGTLAERFVLHNSPADRFHFDGDGPPFGEPRPAHPFRDATKRRLRAIIARALEILDSLEKDPPPAPSSDRESA